MMSTVPQSIRLSRMSLCLAATLASAPPLALCTTRVVSNCLDDGSVGSLRQQVGIAASGDTIDLSTDQLTCSTITLDAGAVVVPQQSLHLVGPTDRAVTITRFSGVAPDRLLKATGDPGLYITGLTLVGGFYYTYSGDAKGGCIYGHYLHLSQTIVSGCAVDAYNGVAAGGGVFAPFKLTLDRSIIQGNYAYSYQHDARGGGAAGGYNELTVLSSTISGNHASVGRIGGRGLGGGVYARTVLNATYSTIDSNHADQGGGIFMKAPNLSYSLFSLTMIGSSVSGNAATIRGGGIDAKNYRSKILNSTIAFNSAPNFGGIYVQPYNKPFYADSSIIARNVNTSPGGFADVYLKNTSFDPAGHNNLIVSYNIIPAAGVIVSTADPQLAPLAYHGGPTRTHALLAGSPAIDMGENTLPAQWDQRGQGYPREAPTGKPDIGAYERQVNDDELFYSGFD